MVILETQRLLLRPWQAADAAQLYRLAREPDVGPRAGWPPHTSEEDSLNIIGGVLGAPETYAIVKKGCGLPVGSIGLQKPDVRLEDLPEDARQLELGYWVGKPYWGRGYAPEAARALLERGFTALDCAAIWCAHYDFNSQSRRVIEKCGFHDQLRKETTDLLGVVHDTLFYVLTREEWQTHD